jgi:hypothetical protein
MLGHKDITITLKVYNSPEKSLKGEDEQLAAAVKEMLKEADAQKK